MMNSQPLIVQGRKISGISTPSTTPLRIDWSLELDRSIFSHKRCFTTDAYNKDLVFQIREVQYLATNGKQHWNSKSPTGLSSNVWSACLKSGFFLFFFEIGSLRRSCVKHCPRSARLLIGHSASNSPSEDLPKPDVKRQRPCHSQPWDNAPALHTRMTLLLEFSTCHLRNPRTFQSSSTLLLRSLLRIFFHDSHT